MAWDRLLRCAPVVVNKSQTNKGELLQAVPNYLEGRLEEADTLTRHIDFILYKQRFLQKRFSEVHIY